MTHQAIDVGCENGRVIEAYVKEYLPMWMGDYKVTRLDIDPKSNPDILHDIREPFPKELLGKYEYVHFTHVLEHMPWRKAVPVFKNVAALTAEGGFFLIAVPSLEYACREIVRGNCDLGIMGMLYGGQDDDFAYHNSGFTRTALEMMTKQIGFNTYSFKETDVIVYIDGKKFRGKQHELMLRNPAVLVVEEPKIEEPKLEPPVSPPLAGVRVVVTRPTKRNRHAKK